MARLHPESQVPFDHMGHFTFSHVAQVRLGTRVHGPTGRFIRDAKESVAIEGLFRAELGMSWWARNKLVGVYCWFQPLRNCLGPASRSSFSLPGGHFIRMCVSKHCDFEVHKPHGSLFVCPEWGCLRDYCTDRIPGSQQAPVSPLLLICDLPPCCPA